MMAALCVDVFLLSCILCLFVNFGSGTERGKHFGKCNYNPYVCGSRNFYFAVGLLWRGLHCLCARSCWLTARWLSIAIPLCCTSVGPALVGVYRRHFDEEVWFPVCFTLPCPSLKFLKTDFS